jgi:hypothetical protein
MDEIRAEWNFGGIILTYPGQVPRSCQVKWSNISDVTIPFIRNNMNAYQ